MEKDHANSGTPSKSELELIEDIITARELGYTALESAFLLDADERDIQVIYEEISNTHTPDTDKTPEQPTHTGANPGMDATSKPQKHSKGPRRGHFSKHVKHDLASKGKLNAKKPMPKEQKQARRRKRNRK